MKGKNYKSLDEIYLNESFAKPVPPLPRNTIYIYREKSDVVVHTNPPHGSIQKFEVSDDMANQIIRNISSQKKHQTEQGELSVHGVIDKVLILDGWKAGNSEYNSLLDRVIKIFTTSNFKPENFNNLIQIQNDKNNKFRNNLLQSPGEVFAFKSLIPGSFLQLFEGEEGYKVADNLWAVTFKAKVNVGSGELAITLLSDSVKGITGDLLFDGIGEVEVKGSNARMGGGGFCHNNTPAELNNIISAEQGKLSEKTLSRIKSDIYNKIKSFIEEREKIKGRVVVAKEDQIKYLSDVRDALDNADRLAEIFKTIDTAGLPSKMAKSLKVSVDEYSRYKQGEVKGQFAPAFVTFFSMAGELTDEQLIRGIVATRNYEASNILPALSSVVSTLYFNYKDELFANGTYTENLRTLVAAIHTVIYHTNQNFRGIIFLNDETRNLLYFKFSNNLQKDIESIYTLYKNANAKINLSIGESFKSAGITLSI